MYPMLRKGQVLPSKLVFHRKGYIVSLLLSRGFPSLSLNFAFWGMLDSKIGLWRVLSQSFSHKAYINLSIPVPALANKANAYLSFQLVRSRGFQLLPVGISTQYKIFYSAGFVDQISF